MGLEEKVLYQTRFSASVSAIKYSGSFFLFLKCDIVKNIAPYVKPFRRIFVYIGENTLIERKGFVMDDTQIVDLYFARSETAIKETDNKYGGYCYKIAYSILANREDSEESVSDAYLSAWNTIPPRKPAKLSTFLGKLTRNISIDRWRKMSAKKRGNGEVDIALEELSECVSGQPSVEDAVMRKEVIACLNRFLVALSDDERTVFLCRYWYANSLEEIAGKTGFSVGKIKSMLHRTRGKLSRQLDKEELR